MANIRVSVSKKGTLIAMIALVVLLGGGGGYLLWRVNQSKTVAPTDSDAYEPKMCRRCIPGVCVNGPYYSDLDACIAKEGLADKCVGCNYQGRYCSMDDTEEYECGVSAYYITYTAGAGGRVSNPGKNSVVPNGSISSTATPNSGYKFVKWSDNKTTAARTDSNIQADATYTAEFQPDKVTLTYVAGTGGSITGIKVQTVSKGGSGTPVTAVAKDGYTFDRWSDDPAKGATRTDSNVQASATYTANFKSTDTPGPAIKNCTGFRVSCGENNTIKVNWNVLPSPATYVVRVNKEPKGDWYNDAGGDLYRSFPVNVNSYVVENVEPGKIYGISVIAHKGTDDNAPFYPSCNMTGLGDVWNPPLYVELACQGTTPVDVPEPIIVPGGTVPDTAIFDDTKDTIIFGIVILTIGITWTWVSRLPKKAYSSIKTISKASSEYVSNVKVKKEKNIRESRRNRLERRIK